MTKKEIKETLEYLKGFGYITPDNLIHLWNCYKELYGKEYQGNKTCGECIRTELRQMLIKVNNEI